MEERHPLSVTMITLNEEARVRAALESVRWADEIVVIDAFSMDATVTICQEFTDRVYRLPWSDYVRQKNLATAKTSHAWVLNLDADERVSPELAQEIQAALRHPPKVVGYYMPRMTWYLGDWVRHCGWYPDAKLRLFRKDAGQWVGRALHEHVEVGGPTAAFRQPLYHYSYRDIADHVQRIDRYTTIAAEHHAGPVNGATIAGHALFTFFKKYLIKQGFRDGTRGLIISVLSALTVAVKYAKAWERSLPPAGEAEGETP
jgi:glycosyltransferase involved in cell wall biosynthesis